MSYGRICLYVLYNQYIAEINKYYYNRLLRYTIVATWPSNEISQRGKRSTFPGQGFNYIRR